jgi:hypothetical protein
MKNKMLQKITLYYKIEPGDSTRYMFSFCFINPTELLEPVILSDNALESNSEHRYILATISMPAGSGAATIPISMLEKLKAPGYFRHTFYYVQTHGWEHIYPYTAAAVLLALSHLIRFPLDLDAAAYQMLQAGDYMLQLDKK